MNRFSQWLYKVMRGRYGQDSLGRFIVVFALILCIVSNFTTFYIYIASLVLLIYEYFRMFSRNITARRRENEVYLKATAGIRRLFSGGRNSRSGRNNGYNSNNAAGHDDSQYKIYKCPKCGQKMRFPRGRGKIEIRCRKCEYQFIRKT